MLWQDLLLLLLLPPTLPLEVKPLSLPSFPDEETTYQPSTEVMHPFKKFLHSMWSLLF